MNITKLTLTRGSKSIEIIRGGAYHLTSVNGLSALSAEHRTYNSMQVDGAVYRESMYNVREVTINMALNAVNYDNVQVLKDAILEMCDPKAGAMFLKVERSGYVRVLTVISDDVPEFYTKNHSRFSFGTLTLIAHQPLFLSENEITVDLNEVSGGWTFPLKFPVQFESKAANNKNIINSGNAETPFIVQIYGACTNPVITNNSTGELIKVNKEIASGEILTIDTDIRSSAKVILTKTDGSTESAYHYIDITSVPFFQLQKGDNLLSYTNDAAAYNNVILRYYNRFLGM